MTKQLIIPRQLDANGAPVSGAKAYVYETGTTTPVTVYTDTGLSVAHANPIVSNAAGYFAQAFYGGALALKVVVTTSADAALVTYDPVPLVPLSTNAAADVTFSPTTEIPQTNVQAAIVAVEAKEIQTADIADEAITAAKFAPAAVSAFAKTFLDDADASAVLATLGIPLTSGTYTTTAVPSTSGSLTIGSQSLSYVKIGEMVFVTGELQISAISSPVGNSVIFQLPFVPKVMVDQFWQSTFYNVAGAGVGRTVSACEARTTAEFDFYVPASAAAIEALDRFEFGFFYRANA